MSWVDFPFPSCPGCARSWETSSHRDCSAQGALLVDPNTKAVRCAGCSCTWELAETRFFCPCGRQFQAGEVQKALDGLVSAAAVLNRIIEGNAAEIKRIQQMGRGSLIAWLEDRAVKAAGTLGKAMGFIIGSVLRGWDRL